MSRLVRMCPDHDRVLDERGTALICPAGLHAVARWKVRDRVTGKETDGGSADLEGAIEPAPAKRALPPPAPLSRPATAPAPAAHQPGTGRTVSKVEGKNGLVVDAMRFVDGSGAMLRLYLRQRRDGTYRVTWARWATTHYRSKVKHSNRAICATLADAQRAFKAAAEEAEGKGWKQQPMFNRGGGRRPDISPIPDAGTAARRRA